MQSLCAGKESACLFPVRSHDSPLPAFKWDGWRRAGCFQSCSVLCSVSVGWFCWSVGTSYGGSTTFLSFVTRFFSFFTQQQLPVKKSWQFRAFTINISVLLWGESYFQIVISYTNFLTFLHGMRLYDLFIDMGKFCSFFSCTVWLKMATKWSRVINLRTCTVFETYI